MPSDNTIRDAKKPTSITRSAKNATFVFDTILRDVEVFLINGGMKLADVTNEANLFLVRDKIKQLIKATREGDFRALARAITIVENGLEGYEELLLSLQTPGLAKIIGITGPPGAGKSTLVNAVIQHWLNNGKKVAVLAVDPSSPFNYGALLGDRVRMAQLYTNPNVYIRSLASRGTLGGLSAKIIEIADVTGQGPFDYIVIETVGVGQSEVEIAGLADCTIVTLVPEAGDMVQTLKAGIMEIADLFVVNKADREAADAMVISLKTMVHERATEWGETPVIKTIATAQTGIPELTAAIDNFLNNGHGATDKKLQLLTDKAWQLIQAARMLRYDKRQIFSALHMEWNSNAFNLYKFVRAQLKTNTEDDDI